jgi:hypothetical protein
VEPSILGLGWVHGVNLICQSLGDNYGMDVRTVNKSTVVKNSYFKEIIMPIEVVIFMLVMFGIFIFNIVYSAIQWSRNNNCEKTVHQAQVIKIENAGWFIRGVRGYQFNLTGTGDATFMLLQNSKKVRLNIPLDEISEMNKGEIGTLTLQGTRYISYSASSLEDNNSGISY